MRKLKWIVTGFIFLSSCGLLDNLGPCEVVINSDGPGFLKVENKLDTKVEVFLPEYAFSAVLRSKSCEIYGLDTGTRNAEISICSDNDCNAYSDTEEISFEIEEGETHFIELTEDFFN
jgi:hypothetical protein